ncbi:MAG: hypothetical protein JSS60_08370 [Verrucomicrobia bacterium]|nr:hypothetical protein [Verrucomicrobiota bacterium]
MTDVSKIQGPAGPSESPGKKEKSSADADKFSEAMRKRVQEVSQVDPDEQKKRKRGEEAEEEEDLNAPQAGPTTPAALVTPFSMEAETKKASPLDLQQGGPGISPTESAQPTTQLPSAPKTAFFQAPASDEMADDSGVLEEGSFGAGAPETQEAAQPPPFFSSQGSSSAEQASEQAQEQQQSYQAQAEQQQAQQQQQQPGWTPEGQQPVTAGPPESQQSEQGKQQQGQQSGHAPSGPPEDKKSGATAMLPKTASPLEEEQQKQAASAKTRQTQQQKPPPGMTAASLEGTPATKIQDTSTFFEQMGKEGQGQGQKGKQGAQTPEEIEEAAEALGPGPAAPPVPFSQTLEGKEEKKVDDKEKTSPMEAMGQPLSGTEAQSMMVAPPPGPETLPPYANMNPQVQEMFDRMVGVMTVMTMSGVTETVITLNTPQFASSVFFGTQIIIQEFSTAPQAFNIQLNGTPQAVALFQGNADDLMAAFQAGNYNFRVNRLETGYLADRPLFKRKEKASGKDQEQTGDNPQ